MHYKWQDTSSLVHDVEFFAVHKDEEALIYAPQGATKELLQRIPETLRNQGFTATPDMVKGEYVLRVQNFNDRNNLLHVLQTTGFTRGAAESYLSEYDHKDPKTLKQQFQDNIMRISGAVYLAGDVLLMGAGALRGDMAELGTGAIWGSTGVVLTAFGKKDADIQSQQLYSKLGDHLKQEGFDFTDNNELSLDKLGGKHGIVNKLQRFLYDHPVEFNNTLQGVGGAMMAKAGSNQGNHYKTAAGVSVMAGQWGGMLVDPVTPDKDQPKPKFPSVSWFLERPLRITGLGASMNNVLNAIGIVRVDFKDNARYHLFDENDSKKRPTGDLRQRYENELKIKADEGTLSRQASYEFTALEHKVDAFEGRIRDSKTRELTGKMHKLGTKDAWKANAAATACYLIANILYGMSNKDTSIDLKSTGKLDEIYAVAAQVIGAQDAQVQPELVQRIAGFLAGQADIKETPQEVADLLQEKIRNLGENPWASPPKPSKSITGAIHQKSATLGIPIQGSLAIH